MGVWYIVDTWSRDFQPIEKAPSRVGVSYAPNRTSSRICGVPLITQTRLLVRLLMHRARPVRHRASRLDSFGLKATFFSSSEVGVRVMPIRRSQVRWSTFPVIGSPRRPWKPETDVTVLEP